MAKTLTSVVGVDIGRYSLKSVLLQKKSGNRFVVADCGMQLFDENMERRPEDLATQVKSLLKQMGVSTTACSITFTPPDAFLRIIEQPETPKDVLREAMRLNGMALFNQECRDFVLDCDMIQSSDPAEAAPGRQKRYLVAGLPRMFVTQLDEAFEEAGIKSVTNLGLSSVSLFNAFEFAQQEVFNNQAFFLLDIGHLNSTMMIGVRRELVLIRSIEFGGKSLLDALCGISGDSVSTVFKALEQEDEIIIENARMAVAAFTREIASSIGFVEGMRDENIGQIWVSGGLAKNKALMRVLGEELRRPCLAWSTLERCEVNVSASKRSQFTDSASDFNVACGAAAQLLNF